jgi:hypothetical protein
MDYSTSDNTLTVYTIDSLNIGTYYITLVLSYTPFNTQYASATSINEGTKVLVVAELTIIEED